LGAEMNWIKNGTGILCPKKFHFHLSATILSVKFCGQNCRGQIHFIILRTTFS
jgi:hypothetical protein